MKTAKWKRLKLDGDGKTELVDEDISDKQKPSDKSSSEKSFSNLSAGTELGFSIALPICGGVLLGVYLDKKFNTAPKLTLSLLFLGVIISFINLIKIVKDK